MFLERIASVVNWENAGCAIVEIRVSAKQSWVVALVSDSEGREANKLTEKKAEKAWNSMVKLQQNNCDQYQLG